MEVPRGAILIVEDAETCATTLELAVSGAGGAPVVVVPAAGDALRLLEAYPGAVCAILTDLNLPHMHGLELIRRVRADGRHAHLPILVVTGDTDPASPARAHEAGADAYFSKPYSPALVRQRLEQLLNESTNP